MARLLRVTSVVIGCAALGLLGCAGRRPADMGHVFPHETWESASVLESLGWSSARVAAIKARVDAMGSSAFMIVTDGKIVAAWGDTKRTFWTHSVRKSFMSALIGMAIADGKIDAARTLGDLGINEKGMPLTPLERQAKVVDLLQARSGVYIAGIFVRSPAFADFSNSMALEMALDAAHSENGLSRALTRTTRGTSPGSS